MDYLYSGLFQASAYVAFSFALILLVLGPMSRRRPKVREGLWIAGHMLMLSTVSVVVLLLTGTSGAWVAVYVFVMVITVCLSLWLRRRYWARQAPTRA